MSSERAADQRQRSESFLREMTDWVARRTGPLTPEAFGGRVTRLAAEYEARCEHYKTDAPSGDIVAQMALVAATHDVLTGAGVPGQEAIDAMVDALARWVRENAEAYSFTRLGITRAEPQMAFQRARENFKSRGEQRFGSHFRYVQEVSDQDRSFVNIERCLFNELGRFLGKPEVTPVFCAMDVIWADEATRPPSNLSFARPTTLAAGGDKCRFQFSRKA